MAHPADPPSREHLRADAQRNRDAVLAAAIELLGRRPDASLDDIARAAGVTRTTVYRHWPNREAVVGAVYATAATAVAGALRAADLERGPVPAAFQRAIDAVLDTADEYAVLSSGPAADPNEPSLVASYEEALAPVIALVERGQERGDLTTDQPAWWIADTLFALLLAALPREAEGRLARSDTPSLVLNSFWSGATPPPVAEMPRGRS